MAIENGVSVIVLKLIGNYNILSTVLDAPMISTFWVTYTYQYKTVNKCAHFSVKWWHTVNFLIVFLQVLFLRTCFKYLNKKSIKIQTKQHYEQNLNIAQFHQVCIAYVQFNCSWIIVCIKNEQRQDSSLSSRVENLTLGTIEQIVSEIKSRSNMEGYGTQ